MKMLLIVFCLINILTNAVDVKALIKSHYEAVALYQKEKNIVNAKIIMENSGVKEIINKKPNDMTDAEYISLLNDYAFFISESENYFDAKGVLERIIELDKNRIVAYLNLGDIYNK